MKKIIIRNGLVATAAVFAFTVIVPVATSARSAHAEEAQERKATAQAAAAEKKEVAQTHLADTKLKACQNREKAITNIMARIGNRGQKQIKVFTKIADRTQAFYVRKGKVLSNYDALVANVTAKKEAAQAAVDATKATSVDFKCDGTDPQGMAAMFKENLKKQNDALKAYKTAVKDLIVGVKSVQGSTTSAEQSGTGDNQ